MHIKRQLIILKFVFINCFFFILSSVLPPTVVTPSTLEAGISKPTSLTCKASGTFGLNVEWENSVGSSYYPRNTYTVEREAKYGLTPKLKNLDKFKCKVHPSYLSCTQNFSCKGFYSFRKDVISKATTTVLVKVCKFIVFIFVLILAKGFYYVIYIARTLYNQMIMFW